jgi:hypothetical protein
MVSVTKILVYGLLAAFAITSLAQPSRAYAATQVFGGVGTSLSKLGTGIKDVLEGTGTGVSKLFNPLYTLRDLIYGPAAGQQAALDVREETSTGNIENSAQAIEASTVLQSQPETLINPTYQTPSFQFTSQPSISAAPVAPSVVHGQTLPLSQAAINHYQSLGVSVSPSNSQTVASRNTSNASAPSTQASNASRSASAPSSASASSTRAASPSSSVSAKSAASVSSSVSRGTSRYSRR